MPAGPFRSLKQDHDENKIVHLRCFDSKSQASDVRFCIKFITNYVPGTPLSATIICGLGSPKRFIDDVHAFTKSTEKAACIHIEKTIIRPDHDKNFAQVVQNELSRGNDIIISQKDACRLPKTILAHPQVHIAIQEIEVSDKILKELPL
jgi:tetraacyldisaccharide 4'-kinase